MYVSRMWQKRTSDMIRTDKTTISENLSSLDSIVKSNNVYSTETAELLYGTMSGYLSGLGDRYAMYLTPEQYGNYISGTAQNSSVGIGISALYDVSADGIFVVNVYPDSPADNSGIIPGDVITHVNGVKASAGGFYSAMLKIGSGEAYTGVLLKIRHSDGTSVDLTVTRDIVTPKSITSRLSKENVGIIRINEFTASCSDDFKSEVQSLITKGADRFVIDIRNNPGGSADAVAALLDFLLPEGVTITSTDKNGAVKQYKSDINEFTYPIALLINQNTVCGAELFCAALKDFGKAVTIGETTYGKATSQQLFSLPDGSAVSISTIIYTTPKGSQFDKSGIDAEYHIPMDYKSLGGFNHLTDEQDIQLSKAIEIILSDEYSGPANG